jgi:uncharacterized membrane protein (GlpM family)
MASNVISHIDDRAAPPPSVAPGMAHFVSMDWMSLALRGLTGGLLVVSFSVLAEAATSKRLAGVFSGAPSVALASLLLTIMKRGAAPLPTLANGMCIGATAFVAYVLTVLFFATRLHPLPATLLAWAIWLVVATVGIWAVPL